ncbi:MAG: Hpt domain-containing protein [Succinivibrionaceae bacterium]|nr:Hpt domain-containing protein [Succinivibrionaceae bacterium]
MITVETLKEYGADTDSGITRCAGMADFYLEMVKQAMTEDRFPALRKSIDDRDFQTAFEIAHGMKGIFANLSLDPVLNPVSEITELLRKKEDTDYSALLTRAETEYRRLLALKD